MKTIYIRNILSDLWKRKLWAAVFVILCSAAAACFALRPGTAANLTEEQEEELAAYHAQLEEYDAAIGDLEASIRENIQQADELRDYVDNSIYMRIDPANIQTAAVQYGLQTEGNTGNILNSFITYINDGGLRESVAEEDKDLQPEYWRDIVSCYINSNILNVTVIHYDAEKCARIMAIVKQRILEHASEVKTAQGEFTLTEMESTQFVKADAGLVNGQNGHRNNLKGYETGLADLRSRLVSYRTNKVNYIKNNEPDFAPEAGSADAGGGENSRIRMIKYALAGVILGVIAAFAAVTLSYILSDRLRSAEDLRDSGLNVLGTCRIPGAHKAGAGKRTVKTGAGNGAVREGAGNGAAKSGLENRTKTGNGTGKTEAGNRMAETGSGTADGTETAAVGNGTAVTGNRTAGDGVPAGTGEAAAAADCGETNGRWGKNAAGVLCRPEPERTAMDIRVLAEAGQKKEILSAPSPTDDGITVFLDQMHEDGHCGKAADVYRIAITEAGMAAVTGSQVMESADDLKNMVEAGCCLLVAEVGKTTYQDLKRHMELCERFRVTMIGCVVIE